MSTLPFVLLKVSSVPDPLRVLENRRVRRVLIRLLRRLHPRLRGFLSTLDRLLGDRPEGRCYLRASGDTGRGQDGCCVRIHDDGDEDEREELAEHGVLYNLREG